MPYKIIKKIRLVENRPFARGSDPAMNFGVVLDDEKTWKLYPLYRSPRPRIRGEVIQLLDGDGNKKYDVNRNFEFNIYCSQVYVAECKTHETRFMYLPPDLVRDYGIDESMAIDLLLHEVVYEHGTKEFSKPIYKPLIIGSMDIAPKDDKTTRTLSPKLTISESKIEQSKIYAPNKLKILFLAANPKDTPRLRLDEEFREIEEKILLAQKKDSFILLNKGAIRTSDLQRHLNLERPDIVHFSSHGTNEGEIILEDEQGSARPVSPKALERVFNVLKDDIRCVILNACFSREQAKAISQHIDCVVGMSSSISDQAAIIFSKAFYLAIASERSLQNAFDQGITELMLMAIPEEHIPQLLVRNNVDPSKIFLLVEKPASEKLIKAPYIARETAETIAKNFVKDKNEDVFEVVVDSVSQKKEGWIIAGNYSTSIEGLPWGFNFVVQIDNNGEIVKYNFNV